jgi:hypothetical protein
MKKNFAINLTVLFAFVFLFGSSIVVFAQDNQEMKTKNDFLERVQFGGGLGLGFGNGYADIMIAPNAIYNFNNYFSAGLGAQYSYVKQRNIFTSNIYGGSFIGLFHPIREIQISTEMDQLRVNSRFETVNGTATRDFWNTALFIGAGYRNENITIGLRYNVLHKDRDYMYVDALMPFVRVFF